MNRQILGLYELWNKIDRGYPRAIYWVVFVAWFIVGALPYFGYPAPFDDIKNFIILLLVVSFLIVVTCFAVYIFRENKDDINAIIEKTNKMLTEGRYEDILILRKKEDWSRFLWLEGKPYARLELGDIAKKAAINLQDYKNMAEIYIDDLGWTSVSIGKYEDARKFLAQGLQNADKIQDNDSKYYWSAKAKRHLAGIELENMEYSEADKLMNDAILFASKIADEQRRNEMLAGIYYGQSRRFLKVSSKNKDNIDVALDYAQKSEQLRQGGENTRFIKTYSLKGQIFEAMNDKINAEEQYRTGLQKSKESKRIDEIIKNHLGLARVLVSEKEKQQHQKSARKLLKKTPVPFEITLWS